MLIIEPVGQRRVTPVVRLGDAEIVVQRLEIGRCRRIVRSGEEFGVSRVGGIDDAAGAEGCCPGIGSRMKCPARAGSARTRQRIVKLIARADRQQIGEVALPVRQ